MLRVRHLVKGKANPGVVQGVADPVPASGRDVVVLFAEDLVNHGLGGPSVSAVENIYPDLGGVGERRRGGGDVEVMKTTDLADQNSP